MSTNKYFPPPRLGGGQGVVLIGLIILLFFLSSRAQLLAVTNPLTPDESVVSATIGVSQLEVPQLITPCDHCVSRNRFEQFSWYRSDLNNVDHYEFILDHTIIASSISPHTNQETSNYITQVTADKVYLNFKSPLTEGSHTWLIRAVTEEVHADSETWQFTIDTTVPQIILQAVDKNIMYWASNDPASIPDIDHRHLTVSTKDPLLSGKVEAYANLKLSLICPPGTTCKHQSITITDADGNWEHRFYDLVKGVTYTAYLSATDAAGNSNYFPEFTITYTPASIIKIPSLIPPGVIKKVTPTPISITIPPSYIEEIAPYKLAPPIPPVSTPTQLPTTDYRLSTIIFWGLLLHLAACLIGFQVTPPFLLAFFSALLFPFGKHPNGSAVSLSRLSVYSAGTKPQLLKRLYSHVTNHFTLHIPLHDLVLIKATRASYTPLSALFYTNANYVLPLIKKDHQSLSDHLLNFTISIRALPLLIAILTSSYALVMLRSFDLYITIYLLISLYLLFVEYVYPKL